MNLIQIDIPASARNTGTMWSRWRNRGLPAYGLAVMLTLFYVLVYWFPGPLAPLTSMLDPIARSVRGAASDQWFLYGTLYTVAVLVMGVRMLVRYRTERYHVIRTLTLMTVQLVLSYLIPATLVRLEMKEFYFSYFWPLKPEYLFPGSIDVLLASDHGLYVFMAWWTLLMSVVATPVLTFFFGKRWYCSWVCGCGALAETAGDPFRHLSSSTLASWKLERWLVHGILLVVILVTALVWWANADPASPLASMATTANRMYGFAIGGLFSGVIGVGFYPLLGSRVWCRFGCPMAAVLGILQKFASRFRITTNGGQCISCGNCTPYCEMGIDVRMYAQRGEDIKRASCVGCGVCASVCPRGVLKLENRKD
jgi:polyferredoxin